MISNMNLFTNQLVSADSTVTKNIILEHLPDPYNLWIDVNLLDGSGTIKGELFIRDDSDDTFYNPSGQGDLFTGHNISTNTNGRDRYAISSPFLGKEGQIRIVNTDGTHDVHVTSDLIIG